MQKIISGGLLAVSSAVCLLAAGPAMADPSVATIWAGGDFKNKSSAGYVGGIYSLDGDLDASGTVLRAQGVFADWGTTGNAGSLGQGNASIGYQMVWSDFVASGFVGVDYQHFSFKPTFATAAKLRQTFGGVVTARVATKNDSFFAAEFEGTYSTANRSYWAKLSPGLRFDNFVVGPELVTLGNTIYREYRVGAFVNIGVTDDLTVKLDAGYSSASSIGGAVSTKLPGSDYVGASLVYLIH